MGCLKLFVSYWWFSLIHDIFQSNSELKEQWTLQIPHVSPLLSPIRISSIESSTCYIQAQGIALLYFHFDILSSPRTPCQIFLTTTACTTTSNLTKAQNKSIKAAPVVRIARMAGQYAKPRCWSTARRLLFQKWYPEWLPSWWEMIRLIKTRQRVEYISRHALSTQHLLSSSTSLSI